MYDCSNLLTADEIGSKLIPLKEVIEGGFAKTEMIIWRNKTGSSSQMNCTI